MNNTPPPNNLEYEQTVLGSVLFRPELFPNVAESLKPDAFYRSDHELIFKAMSAVMAEGRFPDVISVHQYLKAEHPTEGITAHFLFELSENVGTTANLPWYIARLQELATKRKALELWHHVGKRLQNGGDPGPLLSELSDLVNPAKQCGSESQKVIFDNTAVR